MSSSSARQNILVEVWVIWVTFNRSTECAQQLSSRGLLDGLRTYFRRPWTLKRLFTTEFPWSSHCSKLTHVSKRRSIRAHKSVAKGSESRYTAQSVAIFSLIILRRHFWPGPPLLYPCFLFKGLVEEMAAYSQDYMCLTMGDWWFSMHGLQGKKELI